VKIQSGNNILINNNKVINGRGGFLISMMKDVDNITMKSNQFFNIPTPFGSDGVGNSIARNVYINDNVVDSCYDFFRTSSGATMINGEIKNNIIGSIGTYFTNGRFIDYLIEGNEIKSANINNDVNYNMLMYIAPESDNLVIKNNKFGKSNGTKQEILNISKNKIIMQNNIFLPAVIDK
jgi:hypothetical protein